MKVSSSTNGTIGEIKPAWFSWNLVFDLTEKVTGKKTLASLKLPFVFWDTTSDLYDCTGAKLGHLQWSASNIWKNIFSANFVRYELFDAQGTKLASVEHLKSDREDSIMVLKVQEIDVMQFRVYTKDFPEKVFSSFFGAYKKCSITFSQTPTTITIPELVTDPRFLGLVAARQLVPQGNGPFWAIIWNILSLGCWCCLCCCIFMGKDDKEKDDKEAERESKVEEGKPLMEPDKPGEIQPMPPPAKSGVFSCCSRGGAAVAPVR
jgi:hypothetical protein